MGGGRGAGICFFCYRDLLPQCRFKFCRFSCRWVENQKNSFWKSLLGFACACPPFFVHYLSHDFPDALNSAGGFGAVILFGILPALMVWKGGISGKKWIPFGSFPGQTFAAGRHCICCLGHCIAILNVIINMNQFHRLLGGILLVSGTTIGAGMLALPIVTGFAGFGPQCPFHHLLALHDIYSIADAGSQFMDGRAYESHHNGQEDIGRGGKIFSWIIYLFLLYTLPQPIWLVVDHFFEFVESLTGWNPPAWLTPFPFLMIFGFFVYQGARSVDYVNRLLMLGLAISYV